MNQPRGRTQAGQAERDQGEREQRDQNGSAAAGAPGRGQVLIGAA
ncbi:MAG TPA: hypothetical protein VMU82_15225 [Acetobacteraceae bacterium]|nr:hypothetical protein [Acetobacteraceae bacterium]